MLQVTLRGWHAGASIHIQLDGMNSIQYNIRISKDSVYLLRENDQWAMAGRPDDTQKGPYRYGTFKEPFNNRMVFVYGTKGNSQENEWSFNKARYDAETWYYRGNGSVDIIANATYSSSDYVGRNIIIYGNAATNSVFNLLLNDWPVWVDRSSITAGNRSLKGDDLGAYFVWPIKNNPGTSAGVIAGTGLQGMRAVNANQYFAGASGFPDFMILAWTCCKKVQNAIKLAGFFDHQWKMTDTETAVGTE